MICSFFFFFNDTATTEIYTLSLHDALPIWLRRACGRGGAWGNRKPERPRRAGGAPSAVRGRRRSRRRKVAIPRRSEEHTSELQSRQYLVCRLLLEKKKKRTV